MSLYDLLNNEPKQTKPSRTDLILSAGNRDTLIPVTTENVNTNFNKVSKFQKKIDFCKKNMFKVKKTSVYVSNDTMSLASALADAVCFTVASLIELKIYEYLIDEINNQFSLNLEYISTKADFSQRYNSDIFIMKEYEKKVSERSKDSIPQRSLKVNSEVIKKLIEIYNDALQSVDPVKCKIQKTSTFIDLAIKNGIKKDIENINIKTSF